MEFCVLASGSNGNAIYVGSRSSGAGVLLDSGISRRQIKLRLSEKGKDPDNLAGQDYIANKLLPELTAQDFKILGENEFISKEKGEKIKTQLLVTITGMLLLFLNRGFPESFSEFVSQLDDSLDYLLRV